MTDEAFLMVLLSSSFGFHVTRSDAAAAARAGEAGVRLAAGEAIVANDGAVRLKCQRECRECRKCRKPFGELE